MIPPTSADWSPNIHFSSPTIRISQSVTVSLTRTCSSSFWFLSSANRFLAACNTIGHSFVILTFSPAFAMAHSGLFLWSLMSSMQYRWSLTRGQCNRRWILEWRSWIFCLSVIIVLGFVTFAVCGELTLCWWVYWLSFLSFAVLTSSYSSVLNFFCAGSSFWNTLLWDSANWHPSCS